MGTYIHCSLERAHCVFRAGSCVPSMGNSLGTLSMRGIYCKCKRSYYIRRVFVSFTVVEIGPGGQIVGLSGHTRRVFFAPVEQWDGFGHFEYLDLEFSVNEVKVDKKIIFYFNKKTPRGTTKKLKISSPQLISPLSGYYYSY